MRSDDRYIAKIYGYMT